jgi:hypothetical protein
MRTASGGYGSSLCVLNRLYKVVGKEKGKAKATPESRIRPGSCTSVGQGQKEAVLWHLQRRGRKATKDR